MNDAAALERQLAEQIREAVEPFRQRLGSIADQIEVFLRSSADRQPDFWEVANLLGNFMNEPEVEENARERCRQVIDRVREHQGEIARTSRRPTTVLFGTSGWREPIGHGFSIHNVHKVVRGIIEMMETATFVETNGYRSFDEVRKQGIVVLRDNRFMGDEFIEAAVAELSAAGIRIYNAGECPTGVGSAMVTELKAAGSINFTPSHNPMDYAGIKFNPADGGPADLQLTSIIEEKANGFMQEGAAFEPAERPGAAEVETIDAAGLFTKFIETKSRVFDLPKIRTWLRENRDELLIVIDTMHGASRGYIERLLGDDLVEQLRESGSIEFLNTDDDYSFHGVKPEPSAKNQQPLIERLKESGRSLTLAAALDPDADRIRFGDAAMDLDMNRFAAIAYANLLGRGLRGGIATSVPSSDFPLEMARQENLPAFEVPVGFKNFRQLLTNEEVVLAFEESDGITFGGHTLEKDAVAGFLAAVEALADGGRPLSEQYQQLQSRYGFFYPERAGAEVKGVTVEGWQKYKKAVVESLTSDLFATGDTVEIGGETKRIAGINTLDGLKLVFEDKSWILLRPSGTEPKFRYYYEVTSSSALEDAGTQLEAYRTVAESILEQARSRVAALARPV
jgi:phosphomannomutase